LRRGRRTAGAHRAPQRFAAEELQRVIIALSSPGGATRVVAPLRLREMKPPSPLPLAERT
jgi:hypothetical protein